MSNVFLGQPPRPIGTRDAEHVATIVCEAAAMIYPGQPVVVNDGKYATPCSDLEFATGVSDPFYYPDRPSIHKGELVTVLLKPGTITGLRHVWEHPKFASDPTYESSKRLAESVMCEAERITGLSREELIEASMDILNNDVSRNFGGFGRYVELPESYWWAFSVITGQPVTGDEQTSFSCSC